MQRSAFKLSPQDDSIAALAAGVSLHSSKEKSGVAALAAGVSLHSSKEKSGVRPKGCSWRTRSTRVFLKPSPP